METYRLPRDIVEVLPVVVLHEQVHVPEGHLNLHTNKE
jgi:hypothetical protein